MQLYLVHLVLVLFDLGSPLGFEFNLVGFLFVMSQIVGDEGRDQPAILDDGYLVAGCIDFGKDMTRYQDGIAPLLLLLDELDKQGLHNEVKSACRFIEHKDGGIMYEHLYDRELPLHAK